MRVKKDETFISSKVPSAPSKTGVIIEKSNPSFQVSGLKTDSTIRLDKNSHNIEGSCDWRTWKFNT